MLKLDEIAEGRNTASELIRTKLPVRHGDGHPTIDQHEPNTCVKNKHGAVAHPTPVSTRVNVQVFHLGELAEGFNTSSEVVALNLPACMRTPINM